VSDWALAEIERILANMIRIGRVVELDAPAARVKVEVGGSITDWIPWGSERASATRSWSARRPGEQVLVFAPYGDLAQAVVGASLFQTDHPAPAASQDQEHLVFPDGSAIDYNSASNTLTVTVAEGGNVIVNCKHATLNAENDVTVNTQSATINADTTIELATPLVHCTQALTVDGLLTYAGGLVGSGGSGAALDGALSVTGNVSTSGSLQNNGVNVGSTHTHPAPGGTTSTPQ